MTETPVVAKARPEVADRKTWQEKLDAIRMKEKALTRMGDELAAERRQLPMVEVDPRTRLVGADGPVPLLDVFDGRTQLFTYFQMWHDGDPAAGQCEGCSFNVSQLPEPSYLHSRDVSVAVFSQGPYDVSARYRDFMGWTMPWYSVPSKSAKSLLAERYFGMLVCYLRDGDHVYETYWATGRGCEAIGNSDTMLDRTIYGRQEPWEDSPKGWPTPFGKGEPMSRQFCLDGRPIRQWSRLAAGYSDDLSREALDAESHLGR